MFIYKLYVYLSYFMYTSPSTYQNCNHLFIWLLCSSLYLSQCLVCVSHKYNYFQFGGSLNHFISTFSGLFTCKTAQNMLLGTQTRSTISQYIKHFINHLDRFFSKPWSVYKSQETEHDLDPKACVLTQTLATISWVHSLDLWVSNTN